MEGPGIARSMTYRRHTQHLQPLGKSMKLLWTRAGQTARPTGENCGKLPGKLQKTAENRRKLKKTAENRQETAEDHRQTVGRM